MKLKYNFHRTDPGGEWKFQNYWLKKLFVAKIQKGIEKKNVLAPKSDNFAHIWSEEFNENKRTFAGFKFPWQIPSLWSSDNPFSTSTKMWSFKLKSWVIENDNGIAANAWGRTFLSRTFSKDPQGHFSEIREIYPWE